VDNIRGGLVALQVNTGTPSFSSCDSTCGGPTWHSGDISYGPPIVAGGSVWAVDHTGGGLYGFNASTGAQIFHSAGFGVTHFTTPSEAGGQIFVGAGTQVREFNMVAGCQGVTLTAAPPTSAATGSSVTLTASGVVACAMPVYRFWVQPPGGSWGIVRDYAASNTFSWNTTGLAGSYNLEADVKDASSGASYDSTSKIPYTLNGCTGAGISEAPPSPHQPGGTVVVTGSASCPGTATYRFWTRAPAAAWTIAQDYGTSNTYNWPTAGLALGDYGLEVDVRDQAEGTSVSYDAVNNIPYQLNGCSAVSLGAIPASPHYPSGSVTLTGTATCPGTATYRFWTKSPTGPWTMVQDYSTTNT